MSLTWSDNWDQPFSLPLLKLRRSGGESDEFAPDLMRSNPMGLVEVRREAPMLRGLELDLPPLDEDLTRQSGSLERREQRAAVGA